MRYNRDRKVMSMKNDILPKRLKLLRDKKGYKQQFVADKIGVRSNTLSGYETGSRSPDPEMIKKLAELYGVTTDYLLGHSDKPNQTEEEEFQAFINDPELERWYRELPKSEEEDLRRLRQIWQIIKEKENKED